MPITRKDTILKLFYEANGQQTMFGYDNLQFKTVNHPKPHRFVELCSEFKLKKVATSKAEHTVIELNHVQVLGTPSHTTQHFLQLLQ